MKPSLSPVRNSNLDEKSVHEEMAKRQEKIRVLMEEIKGFEQKNTTLRVQVQHNESILNVLEDKNTMNKDMLTRLQEAIESKKQVTLTIADPFIKHNYKKVKEMAGDINGGYDGQDRSLSKTGDLAKSKRRSTSALSDDKSNDLPKVELLRQENEYMLKVISKDDSIPLPAYYKCWVDNN